MEVALYDCTASGRVEYIDHMQMAGWETKVCWYPLQPRRPFAFMLPDARQKGTDQLVVIGTTRRDVDWMSLKQDKRTVQAVVDATLDPTRDLVRDIRGLAAGIEQWTSTMLPVRITR